VRRDLPVLEAQRDLDEAGDPGGGPGVAEVALDRADAAPAAGLATVRQHGAERADLDRIAGRARRTVGLDVLQRSRRQAGVVADLADHGDLGVAGEPPAPVVVDAAGEDHGVDRIAVAHRLGEPLDRDHGGGLGPDPAGGAGIERPRPAVGRQPPAPGLGDRVLRREVERHAAGQRQAALAGRQAAARQVDRDQRRAARGVDRQRRPAEVEPRRDPAGDHRHRGPGRGVLGDLREARSGELQELVVDRRRADEHADALARELGRPLPRVLERLPRDLEQLALLRIHGLGLARADPEERRIELVEPVDVAAAAADPSPGLGRVPADQRPGAAAGRRVDHAAPAGREVAPERPVIAGAAGQPAADADDGEPRTSGVEGVAVHGKG
jgi:hypothetical protein